MGWEAIYDSPEIIPVATDFGVLIRTVGTTQTRAQALIPANVTRGVVTMLRVRGALEMYYSSAQLAVDFDRWSMHVNMQLVPTRDGNFTPEAVLSPDNGADQESNRILWQRHYYPRAGTTITGPGALEFHESNSVGKEVDVKVKRKWDRAEWALMLVVDVDSNCAALHQSGGFMRALFATSDGL